MKNIATKFCNSGDAKCFNENSRNKKKRVYLGTVNIFFKSGFTILEITEKNMKRMIIFTGRHKTQRYHFKNTSLVLNLSHTAHF